MSILLVTENSEKSGRSLARMLIHQGALTATPLQEEIKTCVPERIPRAVGVKTYVLGDTLRAIGIKTSVLICSPRRKYTKTNVLLCTAAAGGIKTNSLRPMLEEKVGNHE